MKNLTLSLLFYFCFFPFFVLAQQSECFVSIETAGSYDKLTVETISLTMLRQFVDSTIQPTPLGGFSEKDCMYRVNVTEQAEGIKVFLLGRKISDYGTSNLRGEPGLEQAILRAIYKGLNEQTNAICQKYGERLEDECNKGQSSGSMQAGPPQNQQGDWQQGPPPPPPRPECQPMPGEKLPEFCNEQPRIDPKIIKLSQRIRKECRFKPGVRPPKKCGNLMRRRAKLLLETPDGPAPPECRPGRNKRLPEYCDDFEGRPVWMPQRRPPHP